MNKSTITEVKNLRNKVHRLEQENQSLRQQCAENCHEDLVEQLKTKYAVPNWLLSERSYEVLKGKTFPEIEAYMQGRVRMMQGNKLKIVSQEAME